MANAPIHPDAIIGDKLKELSTSPLLSAHMTGLAHQDFASRKYWAAARRSWPFTGGNAAEMIYDHVTGFICDNLEEIITVLP